jgi:beta-glucosidase
MAAKTTHSYDAALLFLLAGVLAAAPAASITRSDFPAGFVFGAGSSAYQVCMHVSHGER